jgi:hypothetical protein
MTSLKFLTPTRRDAFCRTIVALTRPFAVERVTRIGLA